MYKSYESGHPLMHEASNKTLIFIGQQNLQVATEMVAILEMPTTEAKVNYI